MLKKPNVSIEGLMESPAEEGGDTGVRIFTTAGSDSFLGILFGEADDSFLIFFPSRLLASGDKRLIEPYMNIPYFRVMKSNISFVLPAYGEFEYFYLEYLINNIPEMYPEFEEVSIGHLEIIKDRFEHLKGSDTNSDQARLVKKEDVSHSNDDEGLLYVAPNTSKYKH